MGTIWPPLACVLLLWACSDAKFSDAGNSQGKPQKNDDVVSDPAVTPGKNEGGRKGSEDPSPETLAHFRSEVWQKESMIGDGLAIAGPFDINFVIDASPSMEEEKQKLESHLLAFLQMVSAVSPTQDFQVRVLGADGVTFSGHPQIRFFPTEVGNHDGMNRFRQFVLSRNVRAVPQNVIFLSDDNAHGDPASYVAEMKTLGEFRYFGIVGLSSSLQNSWCRIASPGFFYQDIAKLSGGAAEDICQEDWRTLLGHLADKLFLPKGVYYLTNKPGALGVQGVAANDELLPKSDWIWDKEANAILFKKGREPAKGAVIEVFFRR